MLVSPHTSHTLFPRLGGGDFLLASCSCSFHSSGPVYWMRLMPRLWPGSCRAAAAHSRLTGRVCLAVFLPPLFPALVAAKTPDLAVPVQFKFYPAIGADLFPSSLLMLLFLPLLSMVLLAAAVAAKTPPTAALSALLHGGSAFRTDVHFAPIIPLGVMVFYSALRATELLAALVAGRLKLFPTPLA